MLKEQAKTFEGLARTVDVGIIAGAFAAASVVAGRLEGVKAALSWVPGLSNSGTALSSDQYALLFISAALGWLAVTQRRGTYLSARADRSGSALWHDAVTQGFWILLIGCVAFFLKLAMVSRGFLLIFLPLSMLLLTLRQAGTLLLLKYARTKGFNLRDVVVLGERERVARFCELIKREPASGYRVIEQLEPGAEMSTGATRCDEVFVVMGDKESDLEDTVLRLVKQGKRVHFVPGLFEATQFRQGLTDFAGIPMLSLGGYGLSLVEAVAKRALDIVGATVLLIVISPLAAVLALWVKLSSSGPVFFKQERIGEAGRRFWIYKFRTMYEDAEKTLHSDPSLYDKYVKNNYKLPKDEDPRITPIGGILRRSSLDELPQLINVLRGEMSLVGPRPIVPLEIGMYGDYGGLFMSVRPGLTGSWQIRGRSDITDYSRRAALDIEYIRDQSLTNDVGILLKTVPAVLLRKGAH